MAKENKADSADTSGDGRDALESEEEKQVQGEVMEANRDETTPSWEGSSCLQPRHPLHLPNPLYKELIQIKNVKARIRKKRNFLKLRRVKV